MPEERRPRHTARLAALALGVGCLALTACGGSSGSASSSVSTQIVGAGVSSTTQAVTTTSASNTFRKVPPGQTPHHLSATAYAELSRYAACVRRHGIPLPPPSRSGTGPIFDVAHIDVTSPKFHAATRACHNIVAGLI